MDDLSNAVTNHRTRIQELMSTFDAEIAKWTPGPGDIDQVAKWLAFTETMIRAQDAESWEALLASDDTLGPTEEYHPSPAILAGQFGIQHVVRDFMYASLWPERSGLYMAHCVKTVKLGLTRMEAHATLVQTN